MSRLSDHLEKHKWKYILGGTIVVAGITTLIVRKNIGLLCGPNPRLLCGPGGSGKIAVDNTARSFSFNMFSDNAGNTTINHNAVTTIHNGARGNSGFVTRCVDTGEVFSTQNAAAKAFEKVKHNIKNMGRRRFIIVISTQRSHCRIQLNRFI